MFWVKNYNVLYHILSAFLILSYSLDLYGLGGMSLENDLFFDTVTDYDILTSEVDYMTNILSNYHLSHGNLRIHSHLTNILSILQPFLKRIYKNSQLNYYYCLCYYSFCFISYNLLSINPILRIFINFLFIP